MDGPPNTLGEVTEAGPRRLSNVCFHSYGLWESRNTATVRVPEVKSSGEVQRQRNSIKEILGDDGTLFIDCGGGFASFPHCLDPYKCMLQRSSFLIF